MHVLARVFAVVFVLAAVAGCGNCAASGNKNAQDMLCRVLDTKF